MDENTTYVTCGPAMSPIADEGRAIFGVMESFTEHRHYLPKSTKREIILADRSKNRKVNSSSREPRFHERKPTGFDSCGLATLLSEREVLRVARAGLPFTRFRLTSLLDSVIRPHPSEGTPFGRGDDALNPLRSQNCESP